MNDWRQQHGETIFSFLKYLNEQSDKFVLKGGTALLACYGLDRFSEDIDLDGKDKNILAIVDSFCKISDFSYRVAKDTDTVKRYMINYGNICKPLKIEASFRRKEIGQEDTTKIKDIYVYNIEALCVMKANAYTSRDKIRDLYDLSFICNTFFDQLSPQVISLLRSAIEYKGIEQFDYIIREQKDELIDNSKLADDFLKMHDRLGLLYDESEHKLITDLKGEKLESIAKENAAPKHKSIKDIIENAKKTASQENKTIDESKSNHKDQSR